MEISIFKACLLLNLMPQLIKYKNNEPILRKYGIIFQDFDKF